MKLAALQLLVVIALALAASACQEQTIDDATLTAKVKAKMIADGRVSATRVNVESVEVRRHAQRRSPDAPGKDGCGRYRQDGRGR
jgi:hypothetical protein